MQPLPPFTLSRVKFASFDLPPPGLGGGWRLGSCRSSIVSERNARSPEPHRFTRCDTWARHGRRTGQSSHVHQFRVIEAKALWIVRILIEFNKGRQNCECIRSDGIKLPKMNTCVISRSPANRVIRVAAFFTPLRHLADQPELRKRTVDSRIVGEVYRAMRGVRIMKKHVSLIAVFHGRCNSA
jgi:hypothetical protein